MSKTPAGWIAALSALALLPAALGAQEGPGTGQASSGFTVPPVIAKVNGVDVSISQFWNRLLSSAGNAVLTGIVDEILIEQEGRKRFGAPADEKGKGKKPSAAAEIEKETERRLGEIRGRFADAATFQKQLGDAGLGLEDVRRQIRIEVLKARLLDDQTKAAAEEVQRYFDENREDLAVPETVHLKHILVATEQEAKDLGLALRVGANFELLAREKSLDQGTKDRGGDLGFFARGMLIPELQEKAFAMNPGDLDVVRTALGYHILKVAEKRPAKPATWDADTRGRIERLLRQQKFAREYPLYIQQLRAKADIKVFLNSQ